MFLSPAKVGGGEIKSALESNVLFSSLVVNDILPPIAEKLRAGPCPGAGVARAG
jgi:hypothetical protein